LVGPVPAIWEKSLLLRQQDLGRRSVSRRQHFQTKAPIRVSDVPKRSFTQDTLRFSRPSNQFASGSLSLYQAFHHFGSQSGTGNGEPTVNFPPPFRAHLGH